MEYASSSPSHGHLDTRCYYLELHATSLTLSNAAVAVHTSMTVFEDHSLTNLKTVSIKEKPGSGECNYVGVWREIRPIRLWDRSSNRDIYI